jgi:hypothetical protein
MTAVPAAPQIAFCNAPAPPLQAGSYLLSVEQSVAGEQVAASYRHEQPVIVTGRHFGLDAGEVVSVYPPAGATADYSGCLPHAVLRRPALPREIQADGPPPPGSGRSDTPWLALLLLTPEEILAGDPAVTVTSTGVHAVPLRDYLEPPPGIAGPAFTPDQVERLVRQNPPDLSVAVIDIDRAAFLRVAPLRDELSLLTHVERVTGLAGEKPDTPADEERAIVIGNRLARGSASGSYIAHLVSVEGFARRLPPSPDPGGQAVRMLSLASWMYTSVPGSHDFSALMRGLDLATLRLPDAIGAPEGRAARHVASALAGGYVAADYQTRLGERTIAWYRGPCLPIAMQRNVQPPYWSAEAAMIYDQDTGLFDVSFAVAWQLGRLLALADRPAADALRRWLDGLRRDCQLQVERCHAVAGGPAASMADQARAALATSLASLAGPGGQPFGPATDPSGLRQSRSTLPGLLDPADLPGLLSSGEDPAVALLRRVRRCAIPAGA